MSGFFITGTDTGVGKTLVTAGLLRAYADKGVRAAGMKPVAAGLNLHEGEWINDDVLMLKSESNAEVITKISNASINPYALKRAIAPHIAAAQEGTHIETAPILAAYRRIAAHAEVVLVEGVGGFKVPLSETLDSAQLACAMNLPLILVVGMRLGCLNHALLTIDSIRAHGLTLAAWVANVIDPEMPALAENIAALDERITAPRLGTIPYLGDATSHASSDVAAKLRIP